MEDNPQPEEISVVRLQFNRFGNALLVAGIILALFFYNSNDIVGAAFMAAGWSVLSFSEIGFWAKISRVLAIVFFIIIAVRLLG